MTTKEWTTLINVENDMQDEINPASHSALTESQVARIRLDAYKEGMLYASSLVNYKVAHETRTHLDAAARIMIASYNLESIL